MSSEFDPYRKWLGIPPEEQPPHHYRLLGISIFEVDRDVIENAADRAMAHVRNYQSGKHSQHSQRILNELAAAKLCLLTAEKKSAYDAQLNSQVVASQAVAAPAATAVPMATPLDAATVPVGAAATDAASAGPVPAVQSRSRSSLRRRRKKSYAVPIGLSVAAIAALVACVVIAANLSAKKNDEGSSKVKKSTTKTDAKSKVVSKSPQPKPANKTRPPIVVDPKPKVVVPKPVPTDPREREAKFQQAVAAARAGLSNRDPRVAGVPLEEAAPLAATREQSDEVARLNALHSYKSKFRDAVEGSLSQFTRNGQFVFDGRTFDFVGARYGSYTYTVDGRQFRSEMKTMPADHAVAFAWQLLDESSATDMIYVATFLAFDNEGGDRDKQKEQARELWRRASEAGHEDDFLAAELKLDELPPEKPDEPAVVDTDPTPAPQRAAVPDIEALRPARLEVRKLFDFAEANTPQQQRELANTLAVAGRDEEDLATAYVCLEEARNLWAKSRSLDELMRIIDDIAARFEVDALREKQTHLTKFALDLNSDPGQVFGSAKQLYDEAKKAARYDVAKDVAEVALRAARKANNMTAIQEVTEEIKRLEKFVSEQRKAISAKDTLDDDPEDPAANQALGRFLCYFVEDWQQGLPLLAKGPPGTETELAQSDLATPDNPDQQLVMGNRWYELYKTKDGLLARGIAQRAKYWYLKVALKFRGTARSLTEERLREINAL